MESYAFDLIRGLSAQNININAYAAKIDTSTAEYALVNACLVNQNLMPKKTAAVLLQPCLQKSPPRKQPPYCLQPLRPCGYIRLRRHTLGLPA